MKKSIVNINESEIKISFIRSPGPGGQNVNKVATAVLLRFNVKHSSSLSEMVRLRLLDKLSNKLTQHGDLLIKATQYRTQERNRQDALNRLNILLVAAATPPKKRKKTKPTKGSIERRIEKKKIRGEGEVDAENY